MESNKPQVADAVTADGSSALSEAGALLIGKISESDGLWSALEDVRHLKPVRNGVFIIFSKNVRGRLGLFCNRYVTGASCQSSGDEGTEALRQLLSVKSGLYGFRACYPGEDEELAQSLALDLWELVAQGQPINGVRPSPLSLIDVVRSGTHQALVAEDLELAVGDGALFVGNMLDPSASLAEPSEVLSKGYASPVGDVVTTDLTDETFSLLQWLSEDGAAPAGGKLRQVLFSALPSLPDKGKTQSDRALENNLETYRRVVEMERDRVIRDIEASMSSGKQREVINDLQLFAEMLETEEKTVFQHWEGLDNIPTPSIKSAGTESLTRQTDVQGFYKKSKEYKRVVEKEEIALDRERSKWQVLRKRLLIIAAVIVLVVTVGTINDTLQAIQSNKILAKGQKELQRGHYELAASLFGGAIEESPGNGRAYLYRGIARVGAGEFSQALTDFDQASLRGYPAEASVATADALCKSGEYEKAHAKCAEVIANYSGPQNADIRAQAYLIDAICHEHDKQYDLADKKCTSGLEQVKDGDLRKRLLHERALVRLEQKDWKAAMQDLQEAKLDLHMIRADAERNTEHYADAIADYTAVIEHDPRNGDAYIGRGICHGKLNQLDEARKDFGRALGINKNSVEALIRRGAINLASGARMQAIDDLAAARRLSPNDLEANKLLAEATGKTASAKPQALIADAVGDVSPVKLPADSQKLFEDGARMLSSGDAAGAVTYLAECVKRKPNFAEARRYLAYALFDIGDMKQAAVQFQALSALSVLPEKDVLTYAKALARSGSIDCAIELLSGFLQRAPHCVAARIDLIKMYNTVDFKEHASEICNQGVAVATSPQEKALLQSTLSSGGDPTYVVGTRRPARKVNKAGDLGG